MCIHSPAMSTSCSLPAPAPHLYVHWFSLPSPNGSARQFMRLTAAPSQRAFRAHHEVMYGRPCEDVLVSHHGAAEYLGILDDDMVSYFRLYGPATRIVAGVWEVQWSTPARMATEQFIAERIRKYADSQADDLPGLWKDRLKAAAQVATRDGTLDARRQLLTDGSFAERCERDASDHYVLETLDVLVLLEMAWKAMHVLVGETALTAAAAAAAAETDAGAVFVVGANYVSAQYSSVRFNAYDAQAFICAVIGGDDPTIVTHRLTDMWDAELMAFGLTESSVQKVKLCKCHWRHVDAPPIDAVSMHEYPVIHGLPQDMLPAFPPAKRNVNDCCDIKHVKHGDILVGAVTVHLYESMLGMPHFSRHHDFSTFHVLRSEATEEMMDSARLFLLDHPEVQLPLSSNSEVYSQTPVFLPQNYVSGARACELARDSDNCITAVRNRLQPDGRVSIGQVSPMFAEFEALSPVVVKNLSEQTRKMIQGTLDLLYNEDADTSQLVQSAFRVAIQLAARPSLPAPSQPYIAPPPDCDFCTSHAVNQKSLITHFVHRYGEACPSFDKGSTSAAALIARVHEFLSGVHKNSPTFTINRNLISMTLEDCHVSKRRVASGVKFACSEPDATFVATLIGEIQ